jgi:hypothetical protein
MNGRTQSEAEFEDESADSIARHHARVEGVLANAERGLLGFAVLFFVLFSFHRLSVPQFVAAAVDGLFWAGLMAVDMRRRSSWFMMLAIPVVLVSHASSESVAVTSTGIVLTGAICCCLLLLGRPYLRRLCGSGV